MWSNPTLASHHPIPHTPPSHSASARIVHDAIGFAEVGPNKRRGRVGATPAPPVSGGGGSNIPRGKI